MQLRALCIWKHCFLSIRCNQGGFNSSFSLDSMSQDSFHRFVLTCVFWDAQWRDTARLKNDQSKQLLNEVVKKINKKKPSCFWCVCFRAHAALIVCCFAKCSPSVVNSLHWWPASTWIFPLMSQTPEVCSPTNRSICYGKQMGLVRLRQTRHYAGSNLSGDLLTLVTHSRHSPVHLNCVKYSGK